MGDVSIYLVQIDSGKTVRVTLPNIMRDAEHRITPGRDGVSVLARLQPGCVDRINGATRQPCRQAAGRRDSPVLAAAVLSDPVHHRVEDLLFGGPPGDAALRALVPMDAGLAAAEAALRELRVPVHRSAVHQLLPVFAKVALVSTFCCLLSAIRWPTRSRTPARPGGPCC